MTLLIAACAQVPAAAEETLRLAAGAKGGVYFPFAQELASFVKSEGGGAGWPQLRVIETNGSIANLQALKRGDADVAIVQNDLGHYAYYGKHGHEPPTEFLALLPLFTEYVQVLTPRQSDIRLLGDLERKRVVVGPKNSGSYWNARQLMEEIGYDMGVHYEPSFAGTRRALRELDNGEADALIYTSARPPAGPEAVSLDLRAIPIPEDLANELTLTRPYYSRSELVYPPGDTTGNTVDTLSVTAYLVARPGLSDSAAAAVVRLVLRHWDELRRSNAYPMVDLGSIVDRRPFPFHSGARAALAESGHLAPTWTKYYVAIASLLLLSGVYWAQRTTDRYDRLGHTGMRGAKRAHELAARTVAHSAIYLYLLLAFALMVLGLVIGIQYIDASFAADRNVESAFSDLGIYDAVIWMFVFMTSGHTGDTFPISPTGKILAGLLPLLGVATVLALLFTALERARAARAAQKRGTLTRKHSDHVLVCGWNDKAPGIIHALTSKDAPERRHVVVLAEFDEDMPLEKHGFDPRYVSYCRGDSANHEVLARAAAGAASAAVVVAGERKRQGRNIMSVLSVLALRRFERERHHADGASLFITAEKVFAENDELFKSCGADVIVESTLIADRLAVQCCLSRFAADFVVDMLSYNGFDAIYAMRVKDLESCGVRDRIKTGIRAEGWSRCTKVLHTRRRNNDATLVGRTLGEIRRALLHEGVNVVGVARDAGVGTSGAFDFHFGRSDTYTLAWDGSREIGSDDTLLYLAAHRGHIVSRTPDWDGAGEGACDATSSVMRLDAGNEHREGHYVVCGDASRCAFIAGSLRDVGVEAVTVLSDGDPSERDGVEWVRGASTDRDAWHRARVADADVVLILAQDIERAGHADLSGDRGEIDAQTILAAQMAWETFETSRRPGRGGRPRLVAEVLNSRSRRLFEDAGVDVTIPLGVIIEKIFAKLVFNRGVVCQFLFGLLAVEDGVYLRSRTVRPGDPYQGVDVADAFESDPGGGLMLGYLPASHRRGLRTSEDQCRYHFITSPPPRSRFRIDPGDVVITVTDAGMRADRRGAATGEADLHATS